MIESSWVSLIAFCVNRGITYGPIRTASAIWVGETGASDGGTAPVTAALSDDLVAACAVLGEEVESLRDVARLGLRLRDRRPGPERRDVGDEVADLRLAEGDAPALRLHPEMWQRHVAGA